ncbi:MAG TPA: YueI family protein [Symbiobacteriaceae bacterium]|nr:YueI family protein [Symbiobacteriaceae bacterium]
MSQEHGSSWADKSPLERTLLTGIHGTPQLRREEKRHFIGEFAERVLVSLTKQQVETEAIDRAVAQAAADPRARLIVIHGDVSSDAAVKYKQLAEAHGLESTRRFDPSFTGDVGLVVVSDRAVK